MSEENDQEEAPEALKDAIFRSDHPKLPPASGLQSMIGFAERLREAEMRILSLEESREGSRKKSSLWRERFINLLLVIIAAIVGAFLNANWTSWFG